MTSYDPVLPGFYQTPRFDGPTFDPIHDAARLTGQLERVWTLMRDGQWRTLDEIVAVTGGTTASVSARLRDLRKPRFGGYTVARRARGDRQRGLFEYQVTR